MHVYACTYTNMQPAIQSDTIVISLCPFLGWVYGLHRSVDVSVSDVCCVLHDGSIEQPSGGRGGIRWHIFKVYKEVDKGCELLCLVGEGVGDVLQQPISLAVLVVFLRVLNNLKLIFRSKIRMRRIVIAIDVKVNIDESVVDEEVLLRDLFYGL